MMGVVRVREEFVNSILADLLSRKVGEWFSTIVGEAIVGSPHRKQPDIYFIEYYGVKIVFEAKVGLSNIEKAKEKCRERVKEGIADICFAVAYDESVANVSGSGEEVRGKLRSTPLRLTIITMSNIDGVDLGEVKLDDIVSVLEKHRIYDELVSKEMAVELAEELKAVLNSAVSTIDSKVLKNIAGIAEQRLGLLSVSKSESEEESEEEE
jgi:hypothetical protein